ncbi:MAG: acyl-CoA dehydrogenase family protein [Alphaproteobacteria bacterium]|nr:acyl-CoA dehydrogenase family protein [Alphaproteobacteria bacterium]
MHFAFTEEQQQIGDAVRDALADACPAGVVRAAWAAPDTAVRSLLADLGVLGLNLPEAVGGLGLGMVDAVLPLTEAGRAAAPVALVETIATNPTLAAIGEADLAAQVATGEAFVTLRAPGGYAVDADRAALVLVVEGDRVGVVRAPRLVAQPAVDGSRRLFAVEGDVEPTDADGRELLDRAALAAAAQLVGLSHHMLAMAVDYAKTRRQFGAPIGSFQAVQHHLVDALLRVRFAAPTVAQAAWHVDAGTAEASLQVAMATSLAADAASLTARKALQVHGAIGYTFEYDLHLWMKRAWSLSAAWGDARAHRARVADHLLGAPDA